MEIKKLFGDCRIVALAGDRNTGKTNNLMALLKDFRKYNKKTNIYLYGLDDITIKWALKLGKVYEVSNLEQLSNKENALIIIDEFQRLRLNDRRYRELLNKFTDFIYHKNNWVILSSPSLREFNSVIGSKIDRWLLKSLKLSSLINGSQIKNAVLNYNGRFKTIDDIKISEDKLLILNEDFEQFISLNYIKEIDVKEEKETIFK